MINHMIPRMKTKETAHQCQPAASDLFGSRAKQLILFCQEVKSCKPKISHHLSQDLSSVKHSV